MSPSPAPSLFGSTPGSIPAPMSSPTSTSQVASSEAPISRLLPVLNQAFFATVYLFSRLWTALKSVSIVFATPFAFILRPIIFIFSPFAVAVHLLFTIFIYTPYRTVIYVSEALYPLYVFVVVAIVTGVVLGLVARQGVSFVGWTMLSRTERKKAPVSLKPVSGGSVRGKRRATVKIEAPGE